MKVRSPRRLPSHCYWPCGSAAGRRYRRGVDAVRTIYANLEGEVLLDNPRVFVQKFIVQPGQFTGHRTHPGDQLMVFVEGRRADLPRDGTLDAVERRAGRVEQRRRRCR